MLIASAQRQEILGSAIAIGRAIILVGLIKELYDAI
jgi:hypothetical protein